jgi:predicted CoA-binding protein
VRSCLIDGEAVCCDEDGIPTFQKLRQRRHDRHVFLSAFDLLELDGKDLQREPIEVRKATLASLLRFKTKLKAISGIHGSLLCGSLHRVHYRRHIHSTARLNVPIPENRLNQCFQGKSAKSPGCRRRHSGAPRARCEGVRAELGSSLVVRGCAGITLYPDLSLRGCSGNGCGSSPGRHTGEAGPLIWRNFLRPIPCDFASNPLTTAQANLSSARERSSHWMIWAMSTYRLDKLFSPRSVAVVGASPRETSPGRAVLRNLRSAGFKGSVSLVNPHYGEIEGIKALKTIQELPQGPDLLVIATPPKSVPGIVAAAGEKGVATAIIITAGLGHGEGSLADACEQAARATGLRLVGPNCLGVLSSIVLTRQAQRQFRGPHAAGRRARFDLAIRRHNGGPYRVVGSPRHWFFGGRLTGR